MDYKKKYMIEKLIDLINSNTDDSISVSAYKNYDIINDIVLKCEFGIENILVCSWKYMNHSLKI
jgi:hypothetical protein